MCYNSHSSGWRRDCRGEGGGHWRDPFRRAWWWSCDQSNPFSGKIWSNKQKAHFPPKILDQWSKAKTEEANDEVVKKIDLDKMDLVEKMSQITQVAQNIRQWEALPQTSSVPGEIGNLHPEKAGGADWGAKKNQGGNFASGILLSFESTWSYNAGLFRSTRWLRKWEWWWRRRW